MASPTRPPSVMAARRGDIAPALRRRQPRRDPNAMVGSAALMSGPSSGEAKITTAAWQRRVWAYYREIPEFRYGVNWKASAISRVNLVAAHKPTNQGEDPTPIDVETEPGMRRYVEIVEQIAGGVTGQGQMLAQLTRMLEVPGVGYINATADAATDSFSSWRVLSNSEVQRSAGSETQVRDHETGAWLTLGGNDLLIKVWNPDPEESWEPSSPSRALIPVLNEISLLTRRIAADARSRLAGNGLLLMPTEVVFPPGQGQQSASETVDSFTQTFVEVTQMPIADQELPSATTPMIATMKGEHIANVRHLTFYSEFNAALSPLRDSAIRRLALGLDTPPEVLLGMGQANHWGAWQIAEEAITINIEPIAELICHALTVGFARAAFAAERLAADDVIVWYDVSDLTTRPDKSMAATEAHQRIVIPDEQYLIEVGLDPSQVLDPASPEFRRRSLLDVARGAPTLAPVMLMLAGVITEAEATQALTIAAQAAAGAQAGGGPPGGTSDTQPPGRALPDQQGAPAAMLLAGADGLVVRELERVGTRLRNAVGRRNGVGANEVACPDPTLLHTNVSATSYLSLDQLLEGAWVRVPLIADRCGADPGSLQATLDSYVRGLVAAGHAHDIDRLAEALGVGDDVAYRTAAH